MPQTQLKVGEFSLEMLISNRQGQQLVLNIHSTKLKNGRKQNWHKYELKEGHKKLKTFIFDPNMIIKRSQSALIKINQYFFVIQNTEKGGIFEITTQPQKYSCQRLNFMITTFDILRKQYKKYQNSQIQTKEFSEKTPLQNNNKQTENNNNKQISQNSISQKDQSINSDKESNSCIERVSTTTQQKDFQTFEQKILKGQKQVQDFILFFNPNPQQIEDRIRQWKQKQQQLRRIKQRQDLFTNQIFINQLTIDMKQFKILVKYIKGTKKLYINSNGEIVRCEILQFMDENKNKIQAIQYQQPNKSQFSFATNIQIGTMFVITGGQLKQSYSTVVRPRYSPYILTNFSYKDLYPEQIYYYCSNKFQNMSYSLYELIKNGIIGQRYSVIAMLTGIQQSFENQQKQLILFLYDTEMKITMKTYLKGKLLNQFKNYSAKIGQFIQIQSACLQQKGQYHILICENLKNQDKLRNYSRLNCNLNINQQISSLQCIEMKSIRKIQQQNKRPIYKIKGKKINLQWSQKYISHNMDVGEIEQQQKQNNNDSTQINDNQQGYACLDIKLNYNDEMQWKLTPFDQYDGIGLCLINPMENQNNFNKFYNMWIVTCNGFQFSSDINYHNYPQGKPIDFYIQPGQEVICKLAFGILTFTTKNKLNQIRIHQIKLPQAKGYFYPICMTHKGKVHIQDCQTILYQNSIKI